MADNAFLLSPFTTISLVPDGGLNWLLVHQLGVELADLLGPEVHIIPQIRAPAKVYRHHDQGLIHRRAPAA